MTPKAVLSIAGSDPSGGAGIQADLKTFAASGVYGMAALAGLTVQNTQGVRAAAPVEPAFVVDQVSAIIDDIEVSATKIGMLSNAAVANAVAELLTARRSEFGLIVLDPVMVATSGDELLTADAVEVVRTRLLPIADLITPNVPEAAVLLGVDPASAEEDLVEQAVALLGAGARAALVKGGHLTGNTMTDVFATGSRVETLQSRRIETRNTHGTGCTLSSAIAAQAALRAESPADGISLEAVEAGRNYLQKALEIGADWRLSKSPDSGHGPVAHSFTG